MFYSGIDGVPEVSGNLAKSVSSDLNETTDIPDRPVSNMSKKKDSHSKDNVVPTYPDGSINYDGTVFFSHICLVLIFIYFFLAIYEDQDESDGKKKITYLSKKKCIHIVFYFSVYARFSCYPSNIPSKNWYGFNQSCSTNIHIRKALIIRNVCRLFSSS